MKKYYINNFTTKEAYQAFIRYMLLNSDAFSFVYFKYRDSDRTKKSTKEIKDLLKPYKICARIVNEWPGTITLNENGHIYRLVMYKACIEAEKALNKASQIYEWQYPEFPTDLCFYKNGYAWFASCAHENLNWFYTNEQSVIDELTQLGVDIEYCSDIDDSKMFYDETSLVQ